MNKLFGTDGIRARAGEFPLTQDFVTRIGSAIAKAIPPAPLSKGGIEGGILIGRDTRASGEWIERALTTGLNANGWDVQSLGVLPTPGIAYLTRLNTARCGISISASHNPFQDNGIKIFGADGFKIPDAIENEIESLAQKDLPPSHQDTKGTNLGTARQGKWKNLVSLETSWLGGEHFAAISDQVPQPHAVSTDAYEKFLLAASPRSILRGKRVAVDCNHGATYQLAPRVLRELGAEVIALNVEPNGTNINQGYDALEPKLLRETVLRERADWGVQFDGDGDRAVFVDDLGNYLDGDFVLAILARDWVERGVMQPPSVPTNRGEVKGGRTVVSTLMANVGLERALSAMNVKMERVAVGDRWVTERMRASGAQIGGEQSGHIVLFDGGHTTGDGIYTAVRIAEIIARKNARLSSLAAVMQKCPQVLVNVNVPRKPPLENFPQIQSQVERAHIALGESARINVRYSGTENLVRVMIEGSDAGRIAQEAKSIARVIQETIN